MGDPKLIDCPRCGGGGWWECAWCPGGEAGCRYCGGRPPRRCGCGSGQVPAPSYCGLQGRHGASVTPALGEVWRVRINDVGDETTATVTWVSQDGRVVEGRKGRGLLGAMVRACRSRWLERVHS